MIFTTIDIHCEAEKIELCMHLKYVHTSDICAITQIPMKKQKAHYYKKNSSQNLNYSLNQHKNWEIIPQIIQNVQAMKNVKLKEEEKLKNQWGHKECQIKRAGYFHENEMYQQTIELIKQQQKYDSIILIIILKINFIKPSSQKKIEHH